MKTPTLLALAIGLTLPLFASASTLKHDAQPALNALNDSLASAELTIALADANQALGHIQAQEIMGDLSAGVAAAEISIALATVNEFIQGVDDQQLIHDLQSTLQAGSDSSHLDLIASVVAERPTLAAAVQELAIDMGYDEALVAAAVVSGLSEAPVTAAGQ